MLDDEDWGLSSGVPVDVTVPGDGDGCEEALVDVDMLDGEADGGGAEWSSS